MQRTLLNHTLKKKKILTEFGGLTSKTLWKMCRPFVFTKVGCSECKDWDVTMTTILLSDEMIRSIILMNARIYLKIHIMDHINLFIIKIIQNISIVSSPPSSLRKKKKKRNSVNLMWHINKLELYVWWVLIFLKNASLNLKKFIKILP